MNRRLEEALRTLRAIRQRYEAGRDAGSGKSRAYTVQVALGHADMLWIAAAVEAIEQIQGTNCVRGGALEAYSADG